MLTILWLGAIAELIYFPALLAGPLGLVFKPRKTTARHEAETIQPPHLQIVTHDDEPADELAAAATNGNGHAPPPHAGKASAARFVRRDSPHRR
jgi:hypothetical protein